MSVQINQATISLSTDLTDYTVSCLVCSSAA